MQLIPTVRNKIPCVTPAARSKIATGRFAQTSYERTRNHDKGNEMKISSKTKKHPTPVSVEYDLPSGLDAKRKKYGDEIVDAAAEDTIVISVQALMRRMIEKGSAQPDIQKAVTAWNPSIRTIVRQSAFEKASSSLDKLTPEERKALLAKLQAIPANAPAATTAATAPAK